MRLLLATGHSYLPDRHGGSASSTHELCLALESRGVEAAVLAQRSDRGRLATLAGRCREQVGLRPCLREDRKVGYLVLRSADPAESARAAVQRFRPTAAIVQAGLPMALATALRAAGTRVLVYFRDVQFHRLGGPIAPAPGLGFLANSRFTASRVLESSGVAPRVVPPLVLPERYRTAGLGRRVLFVNPVQVKGWEIARDLVRARPDLGFDFVHAWRAHDRMRTRWQELDDAPNVEWHAPVADMRPIYARARVVLVPSLATRDVWEEGWGRVVTEAHCSGIPVLASRSGALPESVGPGGLLVDTDAPASEWEAALSSIVDDPARHADLAARARDWAARPEIQPDRLLDALLDAVARLAGG